MNRTGWIFVVAFLPATAGCASGDPQVGRQVFERMQCESCHLDAAKAPALQGVGRRYSPSELRLWLRDPEMLYARRAKRPLNAGFPPMPRMTLTPEEIDDLVAYLTTLKKDRR